MSKEERLKEYHKVLLRKVIRDDFEIAKKLENANFDEQDRKCANCKDFLKGRCDGFDLESNKEVEICMLALAVKKRIFSF